MCCLMTYLNILSVFDHSDNTQEKKADENGFGASKSDPCFGTGLLLLYTKICYTVCYTVSTE